MEKVKIHETTEVFITGTYGFIERKVTKFGLRAKVYCPNGFLEKMVYIVITQD